MADQTSWETLAQQDLKGEELYRFYERAGIYQFSADMQREDADRRAFMEIVKNDRRNDGATSIRR